MRWQTTIVLTIALLLVGGFYYVYEVRWAPERERVETRKGRIFQAEPADVTAVELKRREDTVRFARAGEGWELKAPVSLTRIGITSVSPQPLRLPGSQPASQPPPLPVHGGFD